MKVISEYSHYGGSEILLADFPAVNEEIYEVIGEVTALDFRSSVADGMNMPDKVNLLQTTTYEKFSQISLTVAGLVQMRSHLGNDFDFFVDRLPVAPVKLIMIDPD